MFVFSDAATTVRVLPRENGCEVRFGETILLGNSDLAALLTYLHEDPDGRRATEFAASLDITLDALGNHVRSFLRSMLKAGVSARVWGRWADGVLNGDVPSRRTHGGTEETDDGYRDGLRPTSTAPDDAA